MVGGTSFDFTETAAAEDASDKDGSSDDVEDDADLGFNIDAAFGAADRAISSTAEFIFIAGAAADAAELDAAAVLDAAKLGAGSAKLVS